MSIIFPFGMCLADNLLHSLQHDLLWSYSIFKLFKIYNVCSVFFLRYFLATLEHDFIYECDGACYQREEDDLSHICQDVSAKSKCETFFLIDRQQTLILL